MGSFPWPGLLGSCERLGLIRMVTLDTGRAFLLLMPFRSFGSGQLSHSFRYSRLSLFWHRMEEKARGFEILRPDCDFKTLANSPGLAILMIMIYPRFIFIRWIPEGEFFLAETQPSMGALKYHLEPVEKFPPKTGGFDCPDCGHSINYHSHRGCGYRRTDPPKGENNVCPCHKSGEHVALHYIQQALHGPTVKEMTDAAYGQFSEDSEPDICPECRQRHSWRHLVG